MHLLHDYFYWTCAKFIDKVWDGMGPRCPCSLCNDCIQFIPNHLLDNQDSNQKVKAKSYQETQSKTFEGEKYYQKFG